MVLLGLGANLPSVAGPPRATLEAALDALATAGLRVLSRSRWWRSAPLPASDQPWFVNGVVAVATDLEPAPLLGLLHAAEARFGRVRGVANAARTLDLDLLAYGGRVTRGGGLGLDLPHPRLHQRAFVLLPLAEIAPGWRHPVTGLSVEAMIAALPPGQVTVPEGCGIMP